jgi:hypothetical protein
LVNDVESVFGKRFSENRVKNFWYSKGKHINRSPKEGNTESEDNSSSPSPSEEDDEYGKTSPMDVLCQVAELMYNRDFLNG